MPITPRFVVSQAADFVTIAISVPHIRVSGAEFHVQDRDFTFHCKPYFLKLTLPHAVFDDDDQCKAVYDPEDDRGVIRVTLPKCEPGLHFPDLDLQTQLLQLRRDKDEATHSFPSIEVLSEETHKTSGGAEEDGEEEGGSGDPGLLPPSSSLLVTSRQNYYGFNCKYTQVLTNLREETAEMTSLPDPENMTLSSRQQLRCQSEESDFDPERYIGDLFCGEEDYFYGAAMGHCAQWDKHWELWKATKESTSAPSPDNVTDQKKTEMECSLRAQVFETCGGFSQEERDIMTDLPNKKYLIPRESSEERLLMLGLADILFAYCYDHRLTQGEPTVESPYTIATLSPTLSFFEVYSSLPSVPPALGSLATAVEGMKLSSNSTRQPVLGLSVPLSLEHVLAQSGRRCCIYPYLRIFKLIKKIYADVTKVLLLGQRAVLRCLLQTKKIFEKTDTHYLLNKLYIDDYCVWLQSLGAYGDELCVALGREYNASKRIITKESFGLNLIEIEKQATYSEEDVQDEQGINGLTNKVDASSLTQSETKQHPGIILIKQCSKEEDSSDDADSRDEEDSSDEEDNSNEADSSDEEDNSDEEDSSDEEDGSDEEDSINKKDSSDEKDSKDDGNACNGTGSSGIVGNASNASDIHYEDRIDMISELSSNSFSQYQSNPKKKVLIEVISEQEN